jgi:plastocyanin
MKLMNLAVVLGVGMLAACSGSDAAQNTTTDAAAAPVAAAEATTSEAPATGNVIEVKMLTDDQGNNVFQPSHIEAKQGDVLRFELVSGVHNVSFPADQNANAAGLPAASPFLSTPGQTFDVTVTMAAGDYKFQCDPHAALGMVGTLKVTQ